MKGITIVEEHLCRAVELPQLIVVCVFVTLLCVGVLALYRFMYKYTESNANKKLVIACSVGIVIMYIALWTHQIYNYNKTHFEYTIEVDDSVSFNDFFDKYEIVSVDGDRYRVKEIDNHIKE